MSGDCVNGVKNGPSIGWTLAGIIPILASFLHGAAFSLSLYRG